MSDDQKLLEENKILRKRINYLEDILSKYGINYSYDENTIGDVFVNKQTINSPTITKNHARFFYSMFEGRKDVYAKRSGKPNKKTGRYAYYTQCYNFWSYNLCPKTSGSNIKCLDCKNRNFKPLTGNDIINHLNGMNEDCSDVIGMYVLHSDETCSFLVFDFDNHDDDAETWQEEANAIRIICKSVGIDCLVERSRSGNGAHVWLFFKTRIPAKLARKFGDALLMKGSEIINQKSFKSYDRMLPNQDKMPEGGLGNLIALPLQGQALKRGNSAFVDENFIAYSNQWKILKETRKIDKDFIMSFIDKYGKQTINETDEGTEKPWEKKDSLLRREDIDGTLKVYEANGLFVSKNNIKPRFKNKIRRLAAFGNQNFYKRQAQGLPIKDIPRIISCSREYDKYIAIPCGLKENLISLLNNSDIPFEIEDKKCYGNKIDVAFNGKLYENQEKAVKSLLNYENGILYAVPSFGKTVIGTYLIAEHKVNTLILLDRTSLMKDWEDNLNKFLTINEEFPEYTTKSGKIRKRKNLIGKLTSSHNSLTGIVDIVMISSLGKGENVKQLVKNYGQIIIDECHHVGTATYDDVLSEANSKYIYGLSATPKREDGQTKKVYMYIGPIRYSFTEKELSKEQSIPHYIFPRFTRFVYFDNKKPRLDELYKMIASSEARNNQIIDDVKECIKVGRSPLVMSKDREHVLFLYDKLKDSADYVFVLVGGKTINQQAEIREQMKNVPSDKTILLIATIQFVGEGFNFPRLDTMFLTMPISYEGKVKQTSGRLHRKYEGKKNVIIYDYVDINVPMLERMYNKRIRTYKQMGYQVCSNIETSLQDCVDSIYESKNYIEQFNKDLLAAQKEIIISSLGLSYKKISYYTSFFKSIQEKGVKIFVITADTKLYTEERVREIAEKRILELKIAGINVKTFSNQYKHFAIIDRHIVWYGSINLLSNEKDDDSMMRIDNKEIANELLENTLINK